LLDRATENITASSTGKFINLQVFVLLSFNKCPTAAMAIPKFGRSAEAAGHGSAADATERQDQLVQNCENKKDL
jgi:hypothetical protein